MRSSVIIFRFTSSANFAALRILSLLPPASPLKPSPHQHRQHRQQRATALTPDTSHPLRCLRRPTTLCADISCATPISCASGFSHGHHHIAHCFSTLTRASLLSAVGRARANPLLSFRPRLQLRYRKTRRNALVKGSTGKETRRLCWNGGLLVVT